MSLTKLEACRHGTMMFLCSDKYIGRSLDIYGEYCEGENTIFDQILSPGEVVVEVGANIGPHTIALAKKVGPAGRVFAFEPQRVLFQILCANIALNEVFHVRAFHAACGREAGHVLVPEVDYAIEGFNYGGVSLCNVLEGEEVPLIALDSLTLPSLRLLKVDVEGMELAVIQGAQNQIRRHRPVLYVENDRRDQSPHLIDTIEALDYEIWWHCPQLFNNDNFAGVKGDIFDGTGAFNIICLPKEHANDVTGFRKITGPNDWWTSFMPSFQDRS